MRAVQRQAPTRRRLWTTRSDHDKKRPCLCSTPTATADFVRSVAFAEVAMHLRRELTSLLQTKFSSATVHVAEVTPDGKLFAVVVSDSFAGATDDVRQQQVWRLLRETLTHQDLLRIEFLQLVTRAEHTHAVRWADGAQPANEEDEPASKAELAALSLTVAPDGWTRADFRSLPNR